GRIEAYTDERVEVLGARVKGSRAEVSTIIVSGDVDIPIRYKMRLKGGKWLIYDVVIEEVSLIRNYRSSYRDIVKKEGIDGLLTRMDEKLARLNAS
ncbi:MAG TPA: ABC transporter substrate-binding protein, partial [Gammaproteobacteria bacterium]|nr:ABC transporter substrate-binding protein [Gammaproteobacteria bacterium]